MCVTCFVSQFVHEKAHYGRHSSLNKCDLYLPPTCTRIPVNRVLVGYLHSFLSLSARVLLVGPPFVTITRDQNPSGASNRRHKQLQNDRKRQRKEEQRRQLQTQQHSNTSQLTVPSVHCEADSLELVDHPLVSTSLGPLTNLVPTPRRQLQHRNSSPSSLS